MLQDSPQEISRHREKPVCLCIGLLPLYLLFYTNVQILHVMQPNQGPPQLLQTFSEAFHQAQLRGENRPTIQTATGGAGG